VHYLPWPRPIKSGRRMCKTASATKLCLPPKTYVAPDVDNGVACTCHWTSVGYLEPVDGCAGSVQ
jgi:hypothetical protein